MIEPRQLDMQPDQAFSRTGGEAVLVLDQGLHLVGCNTTGRMLVAGLPEMGRRLKLELLVSPDHLDFFSKAVQKALQKGAPSNHFQAKLFDFKKETFPAVCLVSPTFGSDHKVMGLLITLRDSEFTPMRSSRIAPGEHLMNRQVMGYQALFDHMAEGVFTVNTRWRITSFNHTAEKITGHTRDQVLGRHCWEVFRSDLCEAGCPLRKTLETGDTQLDQDMRITTSSGKRLELLVNTSVLKDKVGNVVGAVETLRPQQISMLPEGHSESRLSLSDIVGQSEPMQRLFEMLPDVAGSQASVLLTGESGTGKELFARAIHYNSPRRHGPFVAVNCSALSESLLESELFGHEKGAFTGAAYAKPGRFELAKGGTLFLDEIGELKPQLQVKLLRVLEQQVFERVGGTRQIVMDARIISATNRDLKDALYTGDLRDDLYYRLRTVPMDLPPLRDRAGDLPLLVNHFIKKFNRLYGKNVRGVDPKVLNIFQNYHWPGNVRELERVLEHAFVFVKGPLIFKRNLPALDELLAATSPPGGSPAPEPGISPYDSLKSHERAHILKALEKSGGRRAQAARDLGISRTSLWRRMKALNLL
ncbi:sigma-54-dependent Fis family transcriptional regulator [Dethiosulfatarculus sandiegensis]|uniref:Fis family transcriptional regulator n=1 Tax=Dethiosulfatarculus sandiegensis TaxID=1429043 RepID=A0A0D2J1V0_9BACT|nr:sigma-54-dependent Fis family transcriptional regulator [Dethiosulfatarculus sandiegensis]KIX12199.1 Fis family transcriptional regulator [Dethiosulfatarculus sandiegensis]